MIKNDKVYDVLKSIAQIWLPALGTLYFTLAGIWGLPGGEQVVGSILAVDTFLGVILQLSSSAYTNSESRFDGQLEVDEDDDRKLYDLKLNDDVETLDGKDEVVFKVVKPNAPKKGTRSRRKHAL